MSEPNKPKAPPPDVEPDEPDPAVPPPGAPPEDVRAAQQAAQRQFEAKQRYEAAVAKARVANLQPTARTLREQAAGERKLANPSQKQEREVELGKTVSQRTV